MFDGPTLYWRTAHGNIPIPDAPDDVSSVAATIVPALTDVPLYTELQGAQHDISDATVIEEDLDDSDDSDYKPSDSDDDSDIEYDSDEYDNETSADEGANHAVEVQRVTDENQVASEKVRAEVTGDNSDDVAQDDSVTVADADKPATHTQYNLRQHREPTFGSYTKPQKLNVSQIKAAKLSFDDIRQGYNPSLDDLQAISYNFMNEYLHHSHTQMSAKKGIRLHGNRAIEALLKELAQLEDMNTFEPLQAHKLSRVQRTEALRVINLIKEKRDNSLKGRTCVDGRPQRKYISKEQAASPTVSTEALLCTLVVDAHEDRYVATADVKGAYLHAEIDDYVILKLDGEVVDVFCKLNPRYKDFVVIEGKADELTPRQQQKFGSIVPKLLWVTKRGRPDIELPVAFLCTRISKCNSLDWKKLRRLLHFLYATINDVRILSIENMERMLSSFTFVDVAYAVHNDMRSHTGGGLSMGRGLIHSKSSKQKLNTKSSTESEVVGASDYLPYLIWTQNFMAAQGFKFKRNIFYQDNQSAMRLERNGRQSCGQKSRHIDIRYFFIKDRIKSGDIDLQYCPTEIMLADFFTKPLQGKQFKLLRSAVMGWISLDQLKSSLTEKSKGAC